MDFNSINNKQILNGKLRMTEPSILFDSNTRAIALHVVDSTEVGRIDLISSKYYRGDSQSELILKFNNISNPFSINEGDELLIPNDEEVLLKWNRITEVNIEATEIDGIRGQFMDTKRLSTKDAKRVEYLKKKAGQLKNGAKEILPPNILKRGETNIDITDDSITI